MLNRLRGFLGGRQEHETQDSNPVIEGEPIIKSPPMEIDGRVMTADEFVAYIESLEFPEPLPTRIFLHHTWKPTRESWRGLDTILAMKRYYEKQLWRDMQGRLHEGWTAGPHLFVADDGIWLFSDIRYDGVGVYGHNYRTRHLEMVGNYDQQLPGGPTLRNTVAALGILHEKLGLDVRELNFHRDFSSKTCPGRAVRKQWIIPQIEQWVQEYRLARQPVKEPEPEDELALLRRSLHAMIEDLIVSPNPETALTLAAKKRGLLGALTNEVPMEIEDQAYVVQIFAEALLVPVHQWDQIQSLREFEASRQDLEEDEPAETLPDDASAPPETDDGTDSEVGVDALVVSGGRALAPPPTDPYRFMGEIRPRINKDAT